MSRDLNPSRKAVALERDVLTVLITIRSAMNQIAPINRLPPEILARIFEFRKGDKDLISATHVCWRWRSALTSTPSLWTGLALWNPSRVFAYLTRSAALPIDVVMTTRAPARRSHLEDFFASPISWVDRVKSLDIGGNEEQIKTVIQRLRFPAPLLQSLKLSGQRDRIPIWRPLSTVCFPRDFLGGQALSLRNLSFHSVSPRIPITKLPLSTLTSLTWIDENSKVTAEDLLSLLMSTPLLELMTIHLRVPPLLPAEKRSTVTLSRLRRLTWFNPEGGFTLTSCLIAPELQWLSLHLVSTTEYPQNGLAGILPPNEGHFPLLIEPTKMRYITQEGIRLYQFHSATGYINITVTTPPGHHNYPTLSWSLWNISISFRQIKYMTVEVGRHPLGKIPIEQLKNLETLEVVGGGNIFFPLAQPYNDTFSGAQVVPFPALLELQITPDSNTSLHLLASVLMGRKQAGHEVETLRIRGKCRKSMVEPIGKMREFVGELVLEPAHETSCTGHQTLS